MSPTYRLACPGQQLGFCAQWPKAGNSDVAARQSADLGQILTVKMGKENESSPAASCGGPNFDRDSDFDSASTGPTRLDRLR